MTPKQILDTMSDEEIHIVYQEYLKKYPGDKQYLDAGIISPSVSKRVGKFINEYGSVK